MKAHLLLTISLLISTTSAFSKSNEKYNCLKEDGNLKLTCMAFSERDIEYDFNTAVIYNNIKMIKGAVNAGYKIKESTVSSWIYNTSRNVTEDTLLELAKLGAKIPKDILSSTQMRNRTIYYPDRLNDGLPKFKLALIKAGADVNARDYTGTIPLMYEDNLDVVKALIKSGADVNARGEGGDHTALMYSPNHEVTKTLIKAGADVNASDRDGKTALMNSISLSVFEKGNSPELLQDESIEITNELIKAGADVNAKDNKGTPLLLRMFQDKDKAPNNLYIEEVSEKVPNKLYVEKVLGALIAAGVDVNAKDNDGNTVLMYTNFLTEKSINMLIKAGADTTAKNKDGVSAMDIAIQNNNLNAYKLLTGYVFSDKEMASINSNKETYYNYLCDNPKFKQSRFLGHYIQDVKKSLTEANINQSLGLNLEILEDYYHNSSKRNITNFCQTSVITLNLLNKYRNTGSKDKQSSGASLFERSIDKSYFPLQRESKATN